MTNAYKSDIDRYYNDLKKQLAKDGVEDESEIVKTLFSLGDALSGDGFDLTPPSKIESASPLVPDSTVTKGPTTVSKVSSDEAYLVKAFQVKSSTDAETVTCLFSSIDGWKSQYIVLKGHNFVVVTNAPRWSKKRIKSALADIIINKADVSASLLP